FIGSADSKIANFNFSSLCTMCNSRHIQAPNLKFFLFYNLIIIKKRNKCNHLALRMRFLLLRQLFKVINIRYQSDYQYNPVEVFRKDSKKTDWQSKNHHYIGTDFKPVHIICFSASEVCDKT